MLVFTRFSFLYYSGLHSRLLFSTNHIFVPINITTAAGRIMKRNYRQQEFTNTSRGPRRFTVSSAYNVVFQSTRKETASTNVSTSSDGRMKRNRRPEEFPNSSNNSRQFSVCSYNVLCQSTMNETGYLYKHCHPQYLTWDHRWHLSQMEFSMLDADVFCLQEVEERYYESHFMKFFKKKGYEGCFKRRLGTKPDGCATFWRSSSFHATAVYEMDFQIANSILDRDNVGLIVVLETKKSKRKAGQDDGNKVIVANTHLLFNPGRGDIKLCQAAMLLSRIQKISNANDDSNGIIICGDFNAVPYSPLYNFMVNGDLHYDGLRRGEISGQERKAGPVLKYPLLPEATNIDENTCKVDEDVIMVNEPGRLSHRLNLVSAYSHRSINGLPEVSTVHSRAWINVDYIFYRAYSKTGKQTQPGAAGTSSANDAGRNMSTSGDGRPQLMCLGVRPLPDAGQVRRTVGLLPNQFHGSDHLPVMARFEFM